MRVIDVTVDIDAAFKALADPIRRSLLEALTKTEFYCHIDGEEVNGICVQDLSDMLELPQSTVSRHLAILRHAGLVGHLQKGVWHYYFCHTNVVRDIQAWLVSLMKQTAQ